MFIANPEAGGSQGPGLSSCSLFVQCLAQQGSDACVGSVRATAIQISINHSYISHLFSSIVSTSSNTLLVSIAVNAARCEAVTWTTHHKRIVQYFKNILNTNERIISEETASWAPRCLSACIGPTALMSGGWSSEKGAARLLTSHIHTVLCQYIAMLRCGLRHCLLFQSTTAHSSQHPTIKGGWTGCGFAPTSFFLVLPNAGLCGVFSAMMIDDAPAM